MKRLFAYTLATSVVLSPAGYAQDEEEEEAGGLLVGFLEDTLSSENRSIQVIGLEGTFSSRATIKQLTVSDDEGVWLSVENAVLDWNRLALLRGRFSVNALGAEKVELLRSPNPVEAPADLPEPEAQPFSLPELPVSIEIGSISIPSIILGEDLMGASALLRLEGKLQLADGALDTDLDVTRLDRQGDGLSLQADYSNETRIIDLDLDLREGIGGVLATTLNLPGSPSVALSAKGNGPVEDFVADIRLATNEEERLSGQVELLAQGTEDGGTPTGIGFRADIGGDVRPLLPEDYRSFFGDELALKVAGQNSAETGLKVDDLSLSAASLDLDGEFAMTPDGLIETAILDARLFPQDGETSVLLPLPDPQTRLASAQVSLRKQAETGDRFELTAEIAGLDRVDVTAGSISLTASGQLDQSAGFNVDADVSAALSALSLADDALSEAIGTELSLTTRVVTDGSGALKLRDLSASGEDYYAQGDFAVKGLSTGMEFETLLTLGAEDLSRFSGLANQDLQGSVSAEVAASGAPLSGVYDVDLTVNGDDLATGIAQLDGLLTGRTSLHVKGARGFDGLRLDDLSLNAAGLEATGSGRLNSQSGTIALTGELYDLGLVIPGETGAVRVAADITRDGRLISGDFDLTAEDGSSVAFNGEADLDGNVDVDFDAFVARLERFLPEFVGNLNADGKAIRDNGIWRFDTKASAPLGVALDAQGTFDENSGAADVYASGNLRLDMANPFIAPQEVDGTARFDVTLRGTLDELVADAEAQLDAFSYSDPGISNAIGPKLSLSTRIVTDLGDSVDIQDLNLEGQDYALRGTAQVTGLSSDMSVSSDLRLGLSDLGRLSAIAGQDLGGTVSAAIKADASLAEQAFDIALDALGRDVTTGIPKVDALLFGSTTLQVKTNLVDETLSIETFALTAAGFDATAGGQMTNQDGSLSFDAKVNDIGPFVPGVSGPLTLSADVTRDDRQFQGDVRLNGPSDSYAYVNGSADLDGAVSIDFDALVKDLQRFAPELSGDLAAKGNAQRDGQLWTFQTNAEAPVGIKTEASGTFAEDTGEADIAMSGSLLLEAANFFIAPNSVEGTAQYEFTLKGKPSLDALSGSITTSGVQLAIPAAKQTLEDISASIGLSDSTASLQISAQSRAGGGVTISGPITLDETLTSAIDVSIDGFVFTDNLSITSTMNGDLSHRGSLTGASSLTGRIDFTETEINLANIGGSVSSAPIPPMRHVAEPAPSYRTREYAGLIDLGTGGGDGGNSSISLDILLSAPSKVFARGRGLQAELGGEIEIKGTTARIEPTGQIELIRGNFNFLGRDLELTKGLLTLQGDLTPYLDFESTVDTSDGTASLLVQGPLTAPEIKATSDPERPSEEALALVLFGDNIQNLSPLALAQVAASAAQLSGGGGRTNSKIREGTGADAASVRTDGTDVGLGLGGYVADNVYTDFSINTKGETELKLNLDVTDNFTVKGTVDQEGETSVGVFFQRDY